MFKDREDFKQSIRALSESLHDTYYASALLNTWVEVLSGYKVKKVDERFMQKDFTIKPSEDNSKAFVSIGAALAGNLGNLGKTNAEVYNAQLANEQTYYSMELTTSTGVVVDVVAFKGEGMNCSFDENENLQIYAFIIYADKNKQLLNHGEYYGRTLNLYGDVPVFIYAPTEGELHGIADYSNTIRTLDSVNKELGAREGEFEGGKRSKGYQKLKEELEEKRVGKPVYMVYKEESGERHIPKYDCNLIDFNLWHRLESHGNNYYSTIFKVLTKEIKMVDMDDVVNMINSYRIPIRKYRYMSREGVSRLDFFSEKILVDVLRLDPTSDRSSVSFKVPNSGFTSSYDCQNVKIVFSVYPGEQFDYDVAEATSNYMDYIGFDTAKKYILFQAEANSTEWDRLYENLADNYSLIQHDNGVVEFIAEEIEADYRTFLVSTDFKYVDDVEKL